VAQQTAGPGHDRHLSVQRACVLEILTVVCGEPREQWPECGASAGRCSMPNRPYRCKVRDSRVLDGENSWSHNLPGSDMPGSQQLGVTYVG
jgi:hypothetical protein